MRRKFKVVLKGIWVLIQIIQLIQMRKIVIKSAHLPNSTHFADFDNKVGHLSIHQKIKLKSWWINFNNFLWCSKENTCSLLWCLSGRCFTYQTTSLSSKSHKVAVPKKREVQYMLDNEIIEPNKSNWSARCILVPKQDSTYRLCTDFRKNEFRHWFLPHP